MGVFAFIFVLVARRRRDTQSCISLISDFFVGLVTELLGKMEETEELPYRFTFYFLRSLEFLKAIFH